MSADELKDLQAELDDLKEKNKDLSAKLKAAGAASKEFDALKAERDKLAGDLTHVKEELKEVNAEARDRRHAAKALEEERDQFALTIEELTAERDTFKTQAESAEPELRKTVEDLTGKLRGIKYERTYEEVAKDLKITNKAKFADLLKLVGHTPDADEPDRAKIAATFGEAIKERPWLVDAEPAVTPTATPIATPTTTPTATPTATQATNGKAGPGADRGASLAGAQGVAAAGRIPGRL